MVSDLEKLNDLNNLYVHIVFVHNRITTPGWRTEKDKDVLSSIVFIYEGEGIFKTDGRIEKAKKGDVIIFDPGKFKGIYTDANNPMKYYTANFHYCFPQHTFTGEWWIDKPPLPFDFITHVKKEDLFRKLKDNFEKLHASYIIGSNSQKLNYHTIFSKIADILSLCTVSQKSSNSKTGKAIEDIIVYISNHYSEKLTLDLLAKKCNMSVSYFSAAFKKIIGASPMEYLLQIRLNIAKEMLADGISVSQIAEQAGFVSIYHFSKMFKKSQGISPTKYLESINKPLPSWVLK